MKFMYTLVRKFSIFPGSASSLHFTGNFYVNYSIIVHLCLNHESDVGIYRDACVIPYDN